MSFLQDLVGTVAEVGAKGFGEISARNQREAEMKMQNDLAIERQKAAEAIRLDMEEQRRQERQKRLSDQRREVDEALPAATQERELSQAQRLAPSVDGNVLDIIKSKLTPDQLEKFYGVEQGPVAELGDAQRVARDRGLYDAEATFAAERKDAVAAVAAAAKARSQEIRDDVMMRNSDTAAKNADSAARRAEAMFARANSPGGGGGRAGNTTFDRQVELLRKAGKTDAQIADFITNKKMPTEAELVKGILSSDPHKGRKNALTVDAAKSMAREILEVAPVTEAGAPAAATPAAAKPAANTPGWGIKRKEGK